MTKCPHLQTASCEDLADHRIRVGGVTFEAVDLPLQACRDCGELVLAHDVLHAFRKAVAVNLAKQDRKKLTLRAAHFVKRYVNVVLSQDVRLPVVRRLGSKS